MLNEKKEREKKAKRKKDGGEEGEKDKEVVRIYRRK